MSKDNLEVFTKAIEKDPKNTFVRYALAMEYRKQKRWDESLVAFNAVIEHDADYIPAYQMGGQTAVDADRADEARDLLTLGIETAGKQGNTHAVSEMTELLETL